VQLYHPIMSKFCYPFLYNCVLTMYPLQLFSNLCSDVYGMRNLIVQMGRKDDVVPGETSRGVSLAAVFYWARGCRVFVSSL